MNQNIQRLKWMVFWHCLKRPEFFSSVKDSLDEMHYFKEFPFIEAGWEVIRDYKDRYREMPTLDVFELEFRPLAAAKGVDEESINMCLHKKFPKYFNSDEDIDGKKYIQDHIEESYHDFVSNRLQRNLGQFESEEQRQDQVASANKILSSNMFSNMQSKNPFSDVLNNLKTLARDSTHSDVMDALIDGAAPGEVVGFMAPSGGGKTTLAMEVFCGHIDDLQTAAYMSGEQAMEGDLSLRMYAVMTGKSRTMFENPDKIDKDAMTIIETNSERWGYHGHFFDFTDEEIDSIKSIDDIFRPLDDMAREGNPPKVVIFDWWGCFVTLLNAGMRAPRDGNEQKEREKMWILEIKRRCKKLGAWALILHQVAGAEAGKSSKHVASSHSAQGNKDLNNMFDFFIVAGSKDRDTNRVKLVSDKARGKENRAIWGKLDGAMCRFLRDNDPDLALEGMTEQMGVQDMSGGFNGGALGNLC